MQNAFNEHIHRRFPFLKDKKLLVAISGGIDSVVLTHLLLKEQFDIVLAHCNFQLRGKESSKDEQFVIEFGHKFSLKTFTRKMDTLSYAKEHGISTQMAARALRYSWFQQLSQENNIDYIVTAHHKDDVIETFLINLTRGTGLEGLLGIPEVKNNVVRPLLPFDRNDILVFATKNKITWREDQSNSSIKYIRNKVRHKIVPVLKELNPSLLETFKDTLNHLQGSQRIVNDRVENIRRKVSEQKGDEIHFKISVLEQLSDPRAYLYELFKLYGFSQWDDIFQLLSTQSGKKVFSTTHVLLKNRDELILSPIKEIDTSTFIIDESTNQMQYPFHLTIEKIHKVKKSKNEQSFLKDFLTANSNEAFFDADTLNFPLTLRKREKGDVFYPIGMQGKKKVSKYFKDEKLSLIEKENVWLLCSGDKIVWIVGMRQDDRFKISKSTQSVLKFSI